MTAEEGRPGPDPGAAGRTSGADPHDASSSRWGSRRATRRSRPSSRQAIDHRQRRDRQVLDDYGVPLLPLKPPRVGPCRAPVARPSRPQRSNPNLEADAPEEGRTRMRRTLRLAACVTAAGPLVDGRGVRPGAKKLNPFTGQAGGDPAGPHPLAPERLLRLPRRDGRRGHGLAGHRRRLEVRQRRRDRVQADQGPDRRADDAEDLRRACPTTTSGRSSPTSGPCTRETRARSTGSIPGRCGRATRAAGPSPSHRRKGVHGSTSRLAGVDVPRNDHSTTRGSAWTRQLHGR